MDTKADDGGSSIVSVLACVLNQLCIRNDRLPLNQRGVSKFHALRPPTISIKDYLSRIAKYSQCSGECFVLALVYIDRIIQSNPAFVVNSLNIHRLLITSVMLAAKFFDDQYFNNAYYARVGGVPCLEMNNLEVEFLFMNNFTLFVTTETYNQYYTELLNHAQNSSCNCIRSGSGANTATSSTSTTNPSSSTNTPTNAPQIPQTVSAPVVSSHHQGDTGMTDDQMPHHHQQQQQQHYQQQQQQQQQQPPQQYAYTQHPQQQQQQQQATASYHSHHQQQQQHQHHQQHHQHVGGYPVPPQTQVAYAVPGNASGPYGY